MRKQQKNGGERGLPSFLGRKKKLEKKKGALGKPRVREKNGGRPNAINGRGRGGEVHHLLAEVKKGRRKKGVQGDTGRGQDLPGTGAPGRVNLVK